MEKLYFIKILYLIKFYQFEKIKFRQKFEINLFLLILTKLDIIILVVNGF